MDAAAGLCVRSMGSGEKTTGDAEAAVTSSRRTYSSSDSDSSDGRATNSSSSLFLLRVDIAAVWVERLVGGGEGDGRAGCKELGSSGITQEAGKPGRQDTCGQPMAAAVAVSRRRDEGSAAGEVMAGGNARSGRRPEAARRVSPIHLLLLVMGLYSNGWVSFEIPSREGLCNSKSQVLLT